MSGPKVTTYSLTRTANAIMQCEQQSLVCVAQTQAVLKILLSSSECFDQQLANIQLLMKRTGKGAEQVEQIKQLQKTLKQESQNIQQELNANMPRISAVRQINEAVYSEKRAQLNKLQTLLRRAQTQKNTLDRALSQNKTNSSQIQTSIIRDLEDPNAGKPDELDLSFLKRSDEKDVREIQRSIVDDLSGFYSFDSMDKREAPDTNLADKKSALNGVLSELLKDESLSPEINKEIKQAIYKLQMITGMQNLTTFDAITVKGLFKKIEAYKYELAQKLTEFEVLLAQYKALCEMAGEEAREFPFSEDAKAAMNAEIERLEAAHIHQQEQTYISECVDEVMAEMGYDLIGTREVKKKSGKRFRNELFTFNEGTAVNVTFSPDGQISMELGGLAREDRIPTEEETGVLTRDMETFCEEFAVFERKMRERGVIVGKRIALSPPTAEYAAIINVNDYEIKESTQIAEINAKEKRRRAAEKKVMRRDD